MKRKWAEVTNPSDEICICVDDPPAAALAVLLVGRGAFGIDDGSDGQLWPIMMFGGDVEATFRSRFECELGDVSHERILAAARTVEYGSPGEIEAVEAMLVGLPDADERRAIYRDQKRTSMNRIVDAFQGLELERAT